MLKKPSLKLFQVFISFFSGLFFVVIIDQFIKHEIRQNDGFYLCNKGISFGISLPVGLFWLIFGLILVLGVLGIFEVFKKGLFSSVFVVGLALFLGGAATNLLDRFLWGCVVDHISFFAPIFPVFNLADIFIFLGGCLVLYSLLSKSAAKGQ